MLKILSIEAMNILNNSGDLHDRILFIIKNKDDVNISYTTILDIVYAMTPAQYYHWNRILMSIVMTPWNCTKSSFADSRNQLLYTCNPIECNKLENVYKYCRILNKGVLLC